MSSDGNALCIALTAQDGFNGRKGWLHGIAVPAVLIMLPPPELHYYLQPLTDSFCIAVWIKGRSRAGISLNNTASEMKPPFLQVQRAQRKVRASVCGFDKERNTERHSWCVFLFWNLTAKEVRCFLSSEPSVCAGGLGMKLELPLNSAAVWCKLETTRLSCSFLSCLLYTQLQAGKTTQIYDIRNPRFSPKHSLPMQLIARSTQSLVKWCL